MGGVLAFPGLGLYHASKWALEGMTESLVQEVERFGIKVTIIEPGGFRTDWGGGSMQFTTERPEYDFLPGRSGGAPRRMAPGDPVKAAAALLQIVDDPNPPLRVLLGVMAFDFAQEAYHRRLAEWDRSKALSRSTEWTED
jgi:NAD(P)-dependent dehydrogenase (short-subunit alcohol dehydrogenase family)